MTGTGEARVEFTTLRAPEDRAATPLVSRAGIVTAPAPADAAGGGAAAPGTADGPPARDADGEPLPARGFSRDSIVRSVSGSADLRSEVSTHLRDTLGSKAAAALQNRVDRALDDALLARTLPAMTRGETVELLRSGDLRVTATAETEELTYRHVESKGSNANVLNEVNQSRLRRPGAFRELGARFFVGPVFNLSPVRTTLLFGGGAGGRERFGLGVTQNAKVSANAKFPRTYAAFDGRMRVTLHVTHDSVTHELPSASPGAQVLLPLAETRPGPPHAPEPNTSLAEQPPQDASEARNEDASQSNGAETNRALSDGPRTDGPTEDVPETTNLPQTKPEQPPVVPPRSSGSWPSRATETHEEATDDDVTAWGTITDSDLQAWRTGPL